MPKIREDYTDQYFLSSSEVYENVEINIDADAEGIVHFRVTKEVDEYLKNYNNIEYPDFLIDLYNNYSTTHSNFVNLTRSLIVGSGFVPFNESLSPEVKALLDYNLQNINPEESANEVLEKVAADFAIHNQAALFITYNKKNRLPEYIYHVDVSNVRAHAVDESQKVKFYHVSPDWSDAAENIQDFDAFNPKKYSKDGQILFIKKHTPGNPYYSIPDYRSAINYILSERDLAVFHNNSINKGFFPSALIEIVGSPSPEQKKAIRKNFVDSFTGVKNTSKLVLNFIEDVNKATKINPFNATTNADLFNALNEIFIQKIATAHGGNADLAGVQTAGADLGGDANKLHTALYYYNKRVIAPYQDIILRAFNKVFKAKGVESVKIAEKQFLPEDPTQKQVEQI